MTTRERKLEFINSFGRHALQTAVTEALCFYGPDFLTDEQIEILTSDKVKDARDNQHRMLRNRPILRASMGLTANALGHALAKATSPVAA